MTRFRDTSKQAAYEKVRTMHDVLSREGSGRGIAYRRGWNRQPYDRTWASWPIYAAGRDNRKSMDGGDLPPVI